MKGCEVDDKLLYNEKPNKRNRVAIVVAERYREKISLVERISNGLMAMENH